MLEETERPKKRRWNVIENDIKRAVVWAKKIQEIG